MVYAQRAGGFRLPRPIPILLSIALCLTCFAFKGVAVAQSVEQRIADLERSAFESMKKLDKLADAIALSREALQIAEAQYGNDVRTGKRLDNLGFLLRVQKQYAEAQSILRRTLTLYEENLGESDPQLCATLSNNAALHEMMGELAESKKLISRCLAIRETAYGPDHPLVAHTLHELAKLYLQSGQSEEAEELSNRAIEILGPDHPAAHLAELRRGERQQDRGRTFLGQIGEYRWTGSWVHEEVERTTLTLCGEATFNNGLWHPFLIKMVQEDGAWRMSAILPVPMYWR